MATKRGKRVKARSDAPSPGLTVNVHAHAAESEPAMKRAVAALKGEPVWTYI